MTFTCLYLRLQRPGTSAYSTADIPEGFAILWTTTPEGRFLAYASVIDNRSGDPVYIPARW